ncbi:MAG: pseudouridine synthase [Oscillatoriales cyanobacterium C42_A2020_001]|nr:pseudouridine synthase [Leptolyngbyaceae cyanobacterium C42_A2020_001]
MAHHQRQRSITKTPSYRYLLFYKPYDVLCQFTSDRATADSQTPPRPTLKDYIAIPDLYPVGRLDHDSEGLLLLTNHGELQHRLINPKFHHPRTYWVQVDRVPDETALQQLRQGVVIQGYRTRPAVVTLLQDEPLLPPREPPIRFRKNVPTAWLEITLTEGRNRQVRRMTAAVGFPTLRLVRVKIANLNLLGLEPGQWRDVLPEELDELKQQLRLARSPTVGKS